jgi:hypothetical protein
LHFYSPGQLWVVVVVVVVNTSAASSELSLPSSVSHDKSARSSLAPGRAFKDPVRYLVLDQNHLGTTIQRMNFVVLLNFSDKVETLFALLGKLWVSCRACAVLISFHDTRTRRLAVMEWTQVEELRVTMLSLPPPSVFDFLGTAFVLGTCRSACFGLLLF